MILEKAKYELDLLNKDKCEIQEKINKDILEIIEVFSKQGHSGTSADYVIQMLEKLLRQKNILPLTGGDDEWHQIAGTFYQNKRDFSIFKGGDKFNGKPYTINGKIFTEDNGKTWFTSNKSAVEVKFPLKEVIPEKVYLKEN